MPKRYREGEELTASESARTSGRKPVQKVSLEQTSLLDMAEAPDSPTHAESLPSATTAEGAPPVRQLPESQAGSTMLQSANETPASNTGVTDTSGAVPVSFFTRGK